MNYDKEILDRLKAIVKEFDEPHVKESLTTGFEPTPCHCGHPDYKAMHTCKVKPEPKKRWYVDVSDDRLPMAIFVGDKYLL